jgi:predicted nucleic acid-binding protein
MKAKVYLETTIASYLTARPSRDLVVAAHQAITKEWWIEQRGRFDLYVSELVLEEVRRGESQMATKRLGQLNGIEVLGVTEEARQLAADFLRRGILPLKALPDALHIATATLQGLDYLLTWNCRHIANGEIISHLIDVCEELGYEVPAVCTPEQLMGD